MEENTNMTEQGTQADNMGNESEVQGAVENSKEQKTFTQEEVNSFVQSRVSQLKRQATKDAQAEMNQKLQELQAREMKLTVKEALSDRGMPKELVDIITCTDGEDLKSKLDALQKIYGTDAKQEKTTGFIQVGAGSSGGYGVIHPGADPMRKAMGLE